jgi:hypothetical protein
VPTDDGRFYGTDSWVAWRDHAPSYLRPTCRTPDQVRSQPAFDISTYRDLATVVSFLNVMNKNDHLLFRGQGLEAFPSPTLLRDTWATHRLPEPVRLVDRRTAYLQALGPLSQAVTGLLAGKLPRHRPFELSMDPGSRHLRVAPWAVIQHYELWPTPLLDLTGSLRVAASFAFGVPASRTTGFLYVFSAPGVVNDLMAAPTTARRLTVRLSAVCPPTTQAIRRPTSRPWTSQLVSSRTPWSPSSGCTTARRRGDPASGTATSLSTQRNLSCRPGGPTTSQPSSTRPSPTAWRTASHSRSTDDGAVCTRAP